ncbi:hypothetical protein TNCV_2663961 [Trichonephila clavipes]|nr:hypothetical protein TNCV_2663961 [Trichonephila clavipes]
MVKGYDLTISHMRNYPFFKKGSEEALKKVRRSGHKHSQFDAIAFPSYPRHARLETDPAIWLTKEVFDKLGPGVKRNGTPDDNSWLRACVASNSERRISTLRWASPDTLDDCQDTVGSGIRR